MDRMSTFRAFVPGLSHHIAHRGNNRGEVFRDADDRKAFLSMLEKAASECSVAIHGYVLMTTHYHAQVTAFEADSLPRMTQSLGSKYVRYFNKRHQRTGTLWEGRYRASLITSPSHWFNSLRYIELNPVRAGLVENPADYHWSSYHANAEAAEDRLVTPHNLYMQLASHPRLRAERWAEICRAALPERDASTIREALRRCRNLGELQWTGRNDDDLEPPAAAKRVS